MPSFKKIALAAKPTGRKFVQMKKKGLFRGSFRSACEVEEAVTWKGGQRGPLMCSFSTEEHTRQHNTAKQCLLKGQGGCCSPLCCLWLAALVEVKAGGDVAQLPHQVSPLSNSTSYLSPSSLLLITTYSKMSRTYSQE